MCGVDYNQYPYFSNILDDIERALDAAGDFVPDDQQKEEPIPEPSTFPLIHILLP